MRIEVSIAKTTALPNGALEALNNELAKRIAHYYPEREKPCHGTLCRRQ